MPSITELSIELVEQIISYLDQPALYALSQASKSSYAITLPVLYRHVDLLIPPGHRIPRIDKFLFNILDRPQIANYVRTLRVGLSPASRVSDGQRFLPGENDVERLGFKRAMDLFDGDPLLFNGNDLREALRARDYGAYAALLLLIIPTLCRLEIHDHRNETLRPFHSVLEYMSNRNRFRKDAPPPKNLADGLLFGSKSDWHKFDCDSVTHRAVRFTAIEEISLNCDSKTGHQHDLDLSHIKVWQAWNLSGIRRVEFMITHKSDRTVWEQMHWRLNRLSGPLNAMKSTTLTNLVIRHSSRITGCLRNMFAGTQQLRSLTCELWHDVSQKEGGDVPEFSLNEWSNALGLVQRTLETLVLSVEFCDSSQFFFKQPREAGHITDSLNLEGLEKLTTLECPVPFISGDYTFLIINPIEPRLPPSLRHLTLRTDISSAQFPYPFDTSILPEGLSYSDAREEVKYLMSARMDVTYLASASLFLVDQLGHLASISVWQPPDPKLDWFDSQLDDLATTCKNKGIAAKVLYPMAMRWRSTSHWNLAKEVTLFDPQYPENKPSPRMFRGERSGVPLGLATQYHLGEFKKRHIRRSLR
ncbi:hypothetical protein P280DRAFT_321887 [Massarina eburnea CBS 473.64]|uniref:F-box domain-containing protein n=1 Tax=Massarina eburnea CBS 473.64 TaxID=1395130 RepID=A0A6A6S2U7_9PLEO|nr:hypothetical protein P280DRAFT_321887 [Massarina eburnea CBS 473.64]